VTGAEGTVLWAPTPERAAGSEVARYMRWLADTRGLHFDDYQALHRWSVEQLEDFWATMWDFLGIRASVPYTRVLDERKMPGAKWFEGARLNCAEHAFLHRSPDRPAILARSETRGPFEVSWVELERQVAAIAASLRELGVRRGDRVASCLPNIPETVVAYLAVTSFGAVWSSCSPDMGTGAVVDRFRQIEPKVLFAVDGYRYGGKPHDRRGVVADIVGALPSLERVIFLPYLDPAAKLAAVPQALPWSSVVAREAKLRFEQVAFDHPLWIVYSSGTTGVPKAIVHGHGGIVIEHVKMLRMHEDMRPGDRLFWVSSTGWIVWTLLASGLLGGCTIVAYDGNPAYPDAGEIWRLVGETKTEHFGCGAALIGASMKAGVEPAKVADLSRLRMISTTGSPLTIDAYEWTYANVKRDLWLASISGGTDIAIRESAAMPAPSRDSWASGCVSGPDALAGRNGTEAMP
jgi:acetoacetyl-CoA synthetase